MGSRVVAPAALAALIGLAALTGCGGATKTTTTVVTAPGQAASGASATQAAVGATVAAVERTPITKASFEHWMSVTAAISHSKTHTKAAHTALKNQVLGFLITSQWVLAEAAHLGLSVSEAEGRQRLHQVTAKQFPKASQLKHYLASIGETEADLLMRVKGELLESKIAQHVTASKTASTEPHLLLSDFQKGFEARWRARTSCQSGYVMEDCREYKGALHAPAASGSSSSTTSSSSSSHASTTSASSNSSGELPSTPGAIAISSSAFERNGAIPAQYTCDGANVSPPLQWQHLPAHTKELVLFVIDDSSDSSQGGIRWVIAGLEPGLSGISAGQLPSGAVVGLNSSGKATYGGICPSKGRSASIEFVLWALSKTIPLANGFTPAVAEHDYSHSELASATTYATYTRP